MTAAVKIYECSASLAGTDKTSSTVRFKLADNTTVDQNDPITIPTGAVSTRSYTKQLRMFCATAPDTKLDNLKAYSDGSSGFGAGVTTNASVMDDFSANTTTWTGGSDLFGYTSGAPLDMDAFHTTDVTATGFFGDLLKLQCVVASPASPGTLTAETLTFSYDEI